MKPHPLATPPARIAAGALCAALIATGTGLLPVAGLSTTSASTGQQPPVSPPPVSPPPQTHPPFVGPPASPSGATSLAGIDLQAALSHGAVLSSGPASLTLQCAVDVSEDADASTERRPVDLALVLDTSGSMEQAMPLLKRATLGVLERLGPQDRLTVVTYSNGARVIYRGVPRQEGATALQQAVAALYASGGTNLSAGIELAAQTLGMTGRGEPIGRRGVRRFPGEVEAEPIACDGEPAPQRCLDEVVRQKRILLLTDGKANQGVTDPYALRELVRGARATGLALSSLGLGLEFNEELLGDLADAGGGLYHYVDAPGKLAAVYKAEVEALQGVVARDATLRLTPAPGVTVEQVAMWPSRPDGAATVVPVGDLARGRSLKVMVRLRLEPGVAPATARDAVQVALAFADPDDGAAQATAPLGLSVGLTDDPAVAQASADPAVAAQVAQVEVGLRLKQAREAAQSGRMEEARAFLGEAKQLAGGEAIEFEAPSGEAVRVEFDALAEGMADGVASERGREALKKSLSASRAVGR